MKQIGRVSVLVVSSDANDGESKTKTSEEFEILEPIQPILSPNQTSAQRLRWAFGSRYMNLHGFVAPISERQRLESLIQNFDLIWILNARTPNILQRWHWSTAHIDLDDIPSTYQRTIAQNSPSLIRRLKARLQAPLQHRRELLFRERFETLSVCSSADKTYLGGSDRIHVIPNGFQRPASTPIRNPSANEPRIGFIGLYSYLPNLDGVRWFFQHCWPFVRQSVPGIRFRLIGKDTDGKLKPSEPDVDALGWVADPSKEIATWSAMIIPIRYGGGTRIKIAEAFSRKCPTISTSVGAFGYEVANGEHLLIADKPRAFADACIQLARDPVRGSEMAERSWLKFEQSWTWDTITPKVCSAAEHCLRIRDIKRHRMTPSK